MQSPIVHYFLIIRLYLVYTKIFILFVDQVNNIPSSLGILCHHYITKPYDIALIITWYSKKKKKTTNK